MLEFANLQCMVSIAVLYPNLSGRRFDHEYYNQRHMPFLMKLLRSSGLIRYEIDKGLAGVAPGSSAPYTCIARLYFNTMDDYQKAFSIHGTELLKDVPNYTDIEPLMQISQMTSS
jgi:uncharacterized protein (TIGR02118 family)